MTIENRDSSHPLTLGELTDAASSFRRIADPNLPSNITSAAAELTAAAVVAGEDWRASDAGLTLNQVDVMGRFIAKMGKQVLRDPEELNHFKTFLTEQEEIIGQRELSVVQHIAQKPSVLKSLGSKISDLPEIIEDWVVKSPVHFVSSFGIPSLVSGAMFARSVEPTSFEYFLYGAIIGLGVTAIGLDQISAVARGHSLRRVL